MQHTSLEDQARTLEATGAYRVLRRIAPLPLETQVPRDQTRVGLFLDLETTGLDPACHEIIEFGMVPFVYTLDGRILGTELPRVYRRAICSVIRQRYQACSDLHRRRVRLRLAACSRLDL